jgi:hypothetical protein
MSADMTGSSFRLKDEDSMYVRNVCNKDKKLIHKPSIKTQTYFKQILCTTHFFVWIEIPLGF